MHDAFYNAAQLQFTFDEFYSIHERNIYTIYQINQLAFNFVKPLRDVNKISWNILKLNKNIF